MRGLAFSPRFLLFLVFPILLVAVEAVAIVARWLASLRGTSESGRRGLEVAGLALAAVALALPLLRTAGLDKQPYREALAHARSLRPDGLVIGIYYAGSGVLYYGVDHPDGAALVPGDTVGVARTLPDLDALLGSSRDPVLVTSQESLLRDSRPALLARIEREFVPAGDLPRRDRRGRHHRLAAASVGAVRPDVVDPLAGAPVGDVRPYGCQLLA